MSKKRKKFTKIIQNFIFSFFQFGALISGLILFSIIDKFSIFINSTLFAIIIVSIIGFGIFIITYYLGKSKKKHIKSRIFGIIIGYLNLIFLFSIVYFLIYSNKPALFGIQKIKEHDKVMLEENLSDAFYDINSEIYCFNILKSIPNKVLFAKEDKNYVKIDSIISLNFISIQALGKTDIFLTIKHSDKKYGYSNADIINPFSKLVTKLYYSENLEEICYYLDSILNKLMEKRENIKFKYKKVHQENRFVNFGDFFFYSASNLSLLNFDKIQSENNLILLINFFQSIFGVFYLAYGITIIWPDKK